MYLLRVEKGKELICITYSDDFDYMKDRFELEIIYMTCRGLKVIEGYDVKSLVREFERDGEWECALILAKGIAYSVNSV